MPGFFATGKSTKTDILSGDPDKQIEAMWSYFNLAAFAPPPSGIQTGKATLVRHVTVDDAPWHWADAGDNHAVVVAGLPPGPHKVLIELADPMHRVITGQTVSFVVPAGAGHAH